MKQVNIYTDGSCSVHSENTPGGWGAILQCNGKEKELSGSSLNTTNNIMEITGVIEALKVLKEPCEVNLYSDSQYVITGMNEWLNKWKLNGWKTTKGLVKNKDLWVELDKLNNIHKITWNWVKGHSSNEFNNRCDKLATEATNKCKLLNK